MLIRVFVENILSFDSEACFSMIPGKESLKPEHIVREGGKRDAIPVLKMGIVYGANASGKSNLVKAIRLLQVLATHSPSSKNATIPVSPFKLGDTSDGLSKIEIELKVDDQYYAYGMRFDKRKIHEEWLFQVNKRTEKKVFERKTEENAVMVSFGPAAEFTNEKDQEFADFVGRGTPLNKSFLKEAQDRNLNFIAPIQAVYHWFEHRLNIFHPETKYRALGFDLDANQDLVDSVQRFMDYFDTGVSGLMKTEVDLEKELKGLPPEILNDLSDELAEGRRALLGSKDGRFEYTFEKDASGELRAYKLITTHRNIQGQEINFEMDEESDGTRRLLDFIPVLVDLVKHDSVFLIDEIDRSMHPNLTRGIIEYFISQLPHTKGQLIVTTHESNLLDLKLFRRDEIWFIEKNKAGHSSCYSLAEFQPRADQDIKKGYLLGRFGAIPFISSPSNLDW